MARRKRKRIHRPGLPPGTLVPPDTPVKVRIQVIHYTADSIEEREVATLEECAAYKNRPGVTWINVDGLGDVVVLQKLGERFGLHPLALEDVHNVGQRPKLDEFGDHLFIVMTQEKLAATIESEQVGIFLGKDYVITIQEAPGDCFDPVRDRLRKGGGRIRQQGPDYLAYALIDALVDQSFPILEKLGERIEDLEQEVVERPTRETLTAIRDVKRDLLHLRRMSWPQREVIHGLQREDSLFVTRETRIFLRDLYDHVIQILDMIESYRELASSMLDIYLSSLSNRMNEIMKVLTVISTIFIPLTFLSGVYGMNFHHMPELETKFGYFVVLGVMVSVAFGMLYWFRRKGWF